MLLRSACVSSKPDLLQPSASICHTVVHTMHRTALLLVPLFGSVCDALCMSPPASAAVVVYSKAQCHHCDTAREFLRARAVDFTEYKIDSENKATARKNLRSMLKLMQEPPRRLTVPQIWVGGEHVGGCSDLLGAAEAGTLAGKLRRAQAASAFWHATFV
eukprot:2233837-Prymnesium_polylepis.2